MMKGRKTMETTMEKTKSKCLHGHFWLLGISLLTTVPRYVVEKILSHVINDVAGLDSYSVRYSH